MHGSPYMCACGGALCPVSVRVAGSQAGPSVGVLAQCQYSGYFDPGERWFRFPVVLASSPSLRATMAFLPTADELASFASVGDVAGWLEMESELLDALTTATGAKSLTLRTWARIPAARWETIVKELQIEDAEAEGGRRGPSPTLSRRAKSESSS